MKKNFLVVLTIYIILIFTACLYKTSDGKKNNTVSSTVVSDFSDEDIKNKNYNKDTDDSNFKFNKPSGDMGNYIQAIDDYFKSVDNVVQNDEILISTPVIYFVDKTDETDIKLYGDFFVEYCDISNKVLVLKGAESRPGVCHIRKQNNEYVVTKLEEAEDGSYYAESISKFVAEEKVDTKADLKPSLEELYASNESSENALEYAKNVILYRYAVENGLDNKIYKDYLQNTIDFVGIRNVKYNGEVYTETGETSFVVIDNSEIIEIENVVTDIIDCQEENASDFEKCNIISEEGQILVNYDGYWRIFEKA